MSEWTGDGTVLVVDDEEPVRYVCQLILEQRGFKVLTATNGQEAVEIYRERADEIDLVLLDMMMPNMSGDQTFKMLREIDASVRVVLSSGFPEDEISDDVNFNPNAFIQKPFLPDELIKTISAVFSAK